MATIVQLRIQLDDVAPLIWRRLLVPESMTLARLHRVLQTAMGWNNTHLHEFRIAGTRYGAPEREPDFHAPLVSEKTAQLKVCLKPGIPDFEYLYDFGDGWQHTVIIEKRRPADPDLRYPLCVAGENACPPEDMGGPPGYAEFLAAIGDPAHRDHRRLFKWIGGAFDPAGFDLQTVNRR